MWGSAGLAGKGIEGEEGPEAAAVSCRVVARLAASPLAGWSYY